jgi:predicted RNA-binding Zn ribbon-like protein
VSGEEELVGESSAWREPSAVQPGDRPPAPGELALVQAFINSHFDLEFSHGADLFATPAALGAWLGRRGLRAPSQPSGADLARALAVREGLRALAGQNGNGSAAGEAAAVAALDEAATGVAVEVRFADGGPRLHPVGEAGLERALGVVLGATARAMIDGSWARLKVCPGSHCGWAFYDHSRNQSGQWCSMAVCGGRAKARAHYRRRRREDG